MAGWMDSDFSCDYCFGPMSILIHWLKIQLDHLGGLDQELLLSPSI